MAATRIQGKESNLAEIFDGNYIFSIPNYQRPYAWQLDQAEPLLEDIVAAMGDPDDPTDDVESYFLGSIVIAKKEGEKEAAVIDGQQRLTTLTILLAVIRSLTQDEESRNELTLYIYEKGKIFTNTQDHFHLSLRKKDEEFFREYIQRDVTLEKLKRADIKQFPDRQQNVILNARKYIEILSQFKQTHIEILAKYIINHCFIIVVTTPSEDSAYRIFSVLNDRGLDLSFTDICKASIIGKMKDDVQDEYTLKWESAEEQVGREGFKEVLSHIRTIKKQARIKTSILHELQEIIKDYEQKPPAFVDELIVPFTSVYETLRFLLSK